MRWLAALLSMLPLSSDAVSFYDDPPTGDLYPAQAVNTSVLLIGDSITLFYADGVVARWPGRAINAGCGGATTLTWQAGRVTPFLLCDQPTWDGLAVPHLPIGVAVIGLGTNDASWPFAVATYDVWLRAIIDQLWTVSEGAQVVLTKVTRRWPPHVTADLDPILASYNDVMQELADESERVSIGADPWELGPEFYAPDGVHLNAAGNEWLTDETIGALLELPEPSGLLLAALCGLAGIRSHATE